MSKNNGGAAFPREDYQCNGANGSLGQEGMSLRDYFAAKAISNMPPPDDYCGDEETKKSYRKWANKAYRMADAMIKARGE